MVKVVRFQLDGIPSPFMAVLQSGLKKQGLDVESVQQLRGGVSGAQLATVELASRSRRERQVVVAKFFPGIGKAERHGSQALQSFLRVPRFISVEDPDINVMDHIPGSVVHDLALLGNKRTVNLIRTLLSRHLRMWSATFQPMPSAGLPEATIGYPTKLRDTIQVLQETRVRIGNSEVPMKDAWKVPLLIEGSSKLYPPLGELVEVMSERVLRHSLGTCLQHGDEGWDNFIVDRDGGVLDLDIGGWGMRPIEEGIAKFLGWFPVVASTVNESRLRWRPKDTRDKLRINTSELLLPHLNGLVHEIKDYFLEHRLAGKVDVKTLHAFQAMQLLRELRWLGRRSNELMRPNIIGMAVRHLAALV